MPTILVVDDEPAILELVRYNLEQSGFTVITAGDGPAALATFRARRPDLVVLDLMLPGMDGFEVCRAIRHDSTVPVILLTARKEEIDRVVGLEIGADDYVTKPFSPRELVARVKAVLRRQGWAAEAVEPAGAAVPGPAAPPAAAAAAPAPAAGAGSGAETGTPTADGPGRIRFKDLVIDVERREVMIRNQPVTLTFTEFELLWALARHPGRVWTRDQLLEQLWGPNFFGDPRTIDVHIRHLREKVETNPSRPDYIRTVRGVGYRLG